MKRTNKISKVIWAGYVNKNNGCAGFDNSRCTRCPYYSISQSWRCSFQYSRNIIEEAKKVAKKELIQEILKDG